MLISLTKYWSAPLWGSTSWTIDYFTVMSLVPLAFSECETEVDLVLIQTVSFSHDHYI